MNKFLIYILLIFGSLNLFAQEEWEEGAEIEDAQIVVEKNKKIELPTANRKFEKIKKVENTKVSTEQNFDDLTPSKIDLDQINPRLKVLKIKSEKPKELYGNYIEAGFGNYVTPMLNTYFNSTRNKDYAYGAHVNHISSQNGPVEYSGMSNSEIGVNGTYFLKNATLQGGLKYNNDVFRYYGFNPDSVLVNDEKSITQNLNTISGNGLVLGNANNLSYSTNILFESIGGRNNLSDLNYGIKTNFGYELADKSSINASADLIMENAKNDVYSVNRTYFAFNPNYKFLHDGINVTAGLNTAYDDDAISGGGKFHIYPHIFLNYPLFVNEVNVFGGVTGGLERNSFSSLMKENQWFLMSGNDRVFNNNKKVDFFGGLKGNFQQKLGYKAQLSFKNYENLHFFINNPLDSTQFTIVSDSGNTSVFSFMGELSYEISEKLITTATLQFNSYDLSTLSTPFHRPGLIFGLNGIYTIQNKVRLNAQANYISGLKGFSVKNNKVVDLKDIIDLNIGLDYKLSDNFSTFVQLNNISSANYSYYLNYPTKRFNALLGITYSF